MLYMTIYLFIMRNSVSMFLLTVYFFKFCPDCTFQCNISVVNMGMYIRMIHNKKTVYFVWGFILYNSPTFLAILLLPYLMCYFQHRFSSSNTLGILNILIVLFHITETQRNIFPFVQLMKKWVLCFDPFLRSFTHSKNSRDPSIEPSGTPHNCSCFCIFFINYLTELLPIW